MPGKPALKHVPQHIISLLATLIITAVLVIALLVLYGASFTMLGLMVMGTDACAYQKCGDGAWLNRALLLANWGGAAILAVTVAATLYRLARKRIAWFVPLIGCVAQVVLALVAAAMEMKAGPV